jgi:hypothetical protein
MPSTQETISDIYHKLTGLAARINTGGGGAGNHNLLSATHPDTDPASPPARGGLIRASAGNEWQEYAIGAAGRYLRSDGTDPLWAAFQVGDLPAHAAEHEIAGGDLVDHNVLTNYAAIRHIDHSAVILTAGEGLSGGGTIEANRTFDLDINGLVEDAAGASGDFFVYYDTVAGDHKKIDWDDMPGGGASPWTVNAPDIWWDGGGAAIIGTNAKSSFMTEGLTIFQGVSDNEILALQSSDVIHGCTTQADTDTYGHIKKLQGAGGGILIGGFGEYDEGMRLEASGKSCNTTKTGSADCMFELVAYKIVGTGRGSMDEGANLFGIYEGAMSSCVFIVDENGTVYIGLSGGDSILFIGDNANSKQVRGITINMVGKGLSSECIALKDVNYINHTATAFTEQDTWAIHKMYNANGGLALTGITETQVGIAIQGLATSDNTTKSTAGLAPIILNAGKIVSNDFGAVGADGNLVAIQNDGSSRWIVDEDGDVWQNGVLHVPNMKSGADQGAAGAAVGELWHDTDDNTVKMGV